MMKMMIQTNAFTALAILWLLQSPASFVLSLSAPSTSRTTTPNPVIKTLARGMGLLQPLFAAEAKLQANLLGNGVDREAVQQEIDDEVMMQQSSSAAPTDAVPPVVIYTYGLSPFSSEAIRMLDASGVPYTKLQLGVEWFLLNGKDSVKRTCLSERVPNGATSLPKIFINGQCIGGCAELAELVENGQFLAMTKPVVATAKKTLQFANPLAKFMEQFQPK